MARLFLALKGKKINNLEELRENFDRQAILTFYKVGRLQKWLEEQGETELLEDLAQLEEGYDDLTLQSLLMAIFDLPDSILAQEQAAIQKEQREQETQKCQAQQRQKENQDLVTSVQKSCTLEEFKASIKQAPSSIKLLGVLQDLADQGNALAQLKLGWCYQEGLCLKEDQKEAKQWLQKAADQGITQAKETLKTQEKKEKKEKEQKEDSTIWRPTSASVTTEKRKSDKTLLLPQDIKLELIKIKAGTFTMGSPVDEIGRMSWETQHSVTLRHNFWLGQFPVTQEQYQAVMGTNPSAFKGKTRPVETIDWSEAKAFCAKLNTLYRDQLPTGYRFDLPTEAQWEYACRAGTTTALNNGCNLTDDTCCFNLDEVAWYDSNAENQTHPVGQKKPNAWGLYDMHGNVYEWCLDRWDFGSDYEEQSVTDPLGTSGSVRVIRGGGWGGIAQYCRSANRNRYDPTCPVLRSRLPRRPCLRSINRYSFF